MTSPGRRPAFTAGESASTSVTRTPRTPAPDSEYAMPVHPPGWAADHTRFFVRTFHSSTADPRAKNSTSADQRLGSSPPGTTRSQLTGSWKGPDAGTAASHVESVAVDPGGASGGRCARPAAAGRALAR